MVLQVLFDRLDPAAIAAGIVDLFADYAPYRKEVRLLRDELAIDWNRRAAEMTTLLVPTSSGK